jgi:predicted TIM-barrel fold metal-dependent hydrolase
MGGCIVEALPKGGDGPAELEFFREDIRVAAEQHQNGPFALSTCGHIQFQLDDVQEKLDRITQMTGVGFHHQQDGRVNELPCRCLRQILNVDPSWPTVDRDYLNDPAYLERFASTLHGHSIRVFELQLNPHQIDASIALIRCNPSITFVLNHLGCPRIGTDDLGRWKGGIDRLARERNTLIKISMLEYIDRYSGSATWAPSPTLADMLDHVVCSFSPQRCMVASNYPVTKASLGNINFFNAIRGMLSNHERSTWESLFWKTSYATYVADGITEGKAL